MRPVRPGAPSARAHAGSGLKQTTGSRPIVEAPGKTRPQRPTGPTVIRKPGIPQVPGHAPGEPKPAHRPRTAHREPQAVQSAPVDESQLTPEQLAAIPTANPVFLQGMVSLILIGVLVVVGAASVYLGVRVFSKPSPSDTDSAYIPGEEPEADEELPNPFLVGQGGPSVCTVVSITGPVVYLIDGGDAMGDLFLYARDAVRASVLSLGNDNTFGVVIAGEEQAKQAGDAMFRGGALGEKTLRPLLRSNYDEDPDTALVEILGASDLKRAVDKALSLKPKTLVMFVRNTDISEPTSLGETIASAGVRLVFVGLGYEYDEQMESYESLVQAAGGSSRLILYEADHVLQSYYDENNLPEY
jgi:hypothetical protein